MLVRRSSALLGAQTANRCTHALRTAHSSRGRHCQLHAVAQSSIADTVADVRSQRRTAVSLVEESLAAIDQTDADVQAFLSVQAELALAAAQAIDAKVTAGDPQTLALPLLGLPVAVKDNLCTAGVETTAASRILKGYLPSYDATAIRRLREAGAIVIGKLNYY